MPVSLSSCQTGGPLKLERATLAEQIAANLLEYIRDAGLNPGETLPSEADLVADFDVSRPIVREALKYLEGRGVIEIENGKGAIIRPIDDKPLSHYFQIALILHQQTLMELLEVRQALEVQGVMLAAERRTDEQLAALRAIVDEMKDAMWDLERYVELDARFHEQIAEASHNKMLFHVIKSIRRAAKDLMFEVQQRRLESAEELQRVQWLHAQIAETVAAGDPEAAANAMRQHFAEAMTKLIDPE